MKTLKCFAAWAATGFLLCFAPATLHAQTLPPDWTFPASLDFWPFEDVSNWNSGTGVVPASFTNIIGFRNGDINDGYSLLVDSTNPAWLSFSLTNETATNLTLPAGSLTLWVAPADWASTSTNGSGPGGGDEGAQLLGVGQWTTNASIGYWGLAFSSDGNNLVFSAQTNSEDGATAIYLTAPISWNTNDWHFIGLTWTDTNSALYLDGELVTNGLGVTVLPSPAVTNIYFGSDSYGLGQCRAFLDDVYTFGTNLAATDFANIYDSQYWEYYLSPYNSISYSEYQADSATQYGTNLAVTISSISNNIASLLAANSSPDVLYEIQSKTNLLQPTWNSEGFIDGSELTNWTAANVPENGRPILFLRLRSWQDSTDTGIPDWWWLQYFGQITNVDAYASAEGDGYSNLQKFQMGLNPTNYYDTNPPPGFFGAVVNQTNAVLVWSPSPGPVTNYLVQRGMLNTNTGNYAYTSFVLSSNVTTFEDVGAITNANAQNNIYNLEALYLGGCVTATDSWYVANYAQQGTAGPPYGPPIASNVWAYPDATGTNLLISWTPAQGSPTNYIIERGIFDPVAYDYNYYPISQVGTNTSAEVVGEFAYATNWDNLYVVIAEFQGGILSVPSISGVNAGPETGVAAPNGFYGYMDSTGTNAWLNWNVSSNAIGYIIYHGTWNYFIGPDFYGSPEGAYSYMEVAAVGAGTNSFEVIGADDAAGDYSGDAYTVVAVYSGGVLSVSATPWQVSTGSPAPEAFSAYLDSTGTNVVLAWSTNTLGATGYTLSRSGDGGNSYSPIAQVSSTASTYKDTNGVAAGESGVASLMYQIQVSYPHGGLSVPIVTSVASTPPAPTGLSASVDSTGTNIVLSWLPALGASGYTIEQGTYDALTGGYTYSVIGTVSAGTTSYTDIGAMATGNEANDVFGVLADETDGDESDLDTSYLNSTSSQTGGNLDIELIHGPSQMELALFSVPNGTAALLVNLVTNDQCGWGDGTNVLFEIPVNSFTNGICVLSDSQYPYYTAYYVNVQAVASNGVVGVQRTIESDCERTIRYPFLDGSQTLKDNLVFALQGQSAIPYPPPGPTDTNYVDNSGGNPDYPNFLWSTEGIGLGLRNGYSFPIPVYAVASFHSELTPGTNAPYQSYNILYAPAPDLSFLPTGRGLHPWEISAADLDWQYQPPAVFCSLNTNYESFVEGGYVTGSGDFLIASEPWSLDGTRFVDSQTTNACPSILAAALGRGILTGDPQFPVVTSADGTVAHVISGIQNAYGLPFDGVYLTYYDYGAQEQVTNYFAAGADCPTNADTTQFWERYDPPDLQPEFYEFSQSTNFYALQPDTVGTNGGTPVTNLLIATVGDPAFNVSAWLRYHLLNGNPGIYGYVEQYWDKAYEANTNGNPTSVETGILSPYGEFFPTEPGIVALVTRTNIENGLTGTGIVHVISLNVDANHDGTMDCTYGGPDFVNTNKPFRFWANDDVDSGDYGGDGIPGQPPQIADGSRVVVHQTDVPVPVPQYARAIVDAYAVHGRRDLVDYFPVYVNIGSLFQSNGLSAGINPNDPNYQFALSQADGVLRFVYTDLTPTNYMNFLRDTNESGKLANPGAEAFPILPQGTCLDPSFIENIATNNGGIILVEAATNTTQPLVLTIYHGTNQIVQTQLPLSISGVEQMFRNKNLVSEVFPNLSNPGPGDRLTDQSVPNEPDTSDKNFVFVHGYNVNPDQARGNASDIFKRMYWAGSHARFYAVTWYAYDSQVFKQVTINLETNIVHAFETAPYLATFLASLNGPTTVAAHSLGNMTVLSALSDYSAPISNYFMLDAALAIEAIDGNIGLNPDMVPSQWSPYTNGLYASEWHNLFSNDFRQTLTWSGRFPNFGNTEVYNFYSSGEEVLREWAADPPTDILSDAVQIVVDKVLGQTPVASFLWVWQEKSKGQAASDGLLGSTHGGWKFNTNYSSLTPAQAALLPNSQLRTNAFFDFSSPSFPPDVALEGALGNLYAYTYGNRILSDAIPALSWAVGSHAVTNLDVRFGGTRNFDMQLVDENGWPPGRGVPQWPLQTPASGEWHHSDYREIAFPFTQKLYDQFVEIGDLK